MRVLFFNHEFPNKDGEFSDTCYRLLREYSKISDMEMDYICTSEDGQYHQFRMGENVMIHCLPVSGKQINPTNLSLWQMFCFAWRSYRFSIELANKKHYDLSHSFFAFPGGLGSLMLSWKKKIPYCVSLQGVIVIKGKTVLKIIKKVLRNAYYVWTDSEKLKDFAIKRYPERKIEKIPKGIDVDNFFPGQDKQKKRDRFDLLCDSRLVPVKGVRFLIQAVKILASRYDQIHMTVIGDGDEKLSLQDLARGLEMEKRIDFKGELSLEERLKHYQEADVFVFSSLEQDPADQISIRRALASGLAIVSTPVFEIEELVLDQTNGFLVRISTADDLADKIEKLILDENLRLLMGKRSHEIANKFSWENVAKQYLEAYTKVKNLEQINN